MGELTQADLKAAIVLIARLKKERDILVAAEEGLRTLSAATTILEEFGSKRQASEKALAGVLASIEQESARLEGINGLVAKAKAETSAELDLLRAAADSKKAEISLELEDATTKANAKIEAAKTELKALDDETEKARAWLEAIKAEIAKFQQLSR
jgi:chromosome segregation ATPase